MKRRQTHSRHRGTHRVVANRHRRVPRSVGWLLILLWIAITAASFFLIASTISSRQEAHLAKSGISVKVDSVKYDDVGKYPFTPPKGQKFVIVHLSVTNNSDRTFNLAPVVQTYLIDGEGQRYAMSPATLKDPINAGPIPPGGRQIGSLSYLVPTSAKNLTLRFKL